MRGAARAAAVLLIGAAASGLGVAPAHADNASPAAVKTAWYWSLVGVSVQGNAVPADPPAAASLVAGGSLGVAYLVDQEDTALGTDHADRVAAVAFDTSSVPLGSTFNSFTLSMPLDQAGQQVKSGTPDLSACEIISTFDGSDAPQSASKVPAYSPFSCVKGTYKDSIGAAGGYAFDLTAIANDWSGGAPAEGVLIRPTTGLSTPQAPFAISFGGKSFIKTSAFYELPPVSTPVPEGVPPAVPGLAPPPPLPGPVVPEVIPPLVPGPVAPAPQVNPQPVAPALAEVAYAPGTLVPSGVWWAGFLGLLALLGVTAAVLGDPLVPVVVDARRRRFAGVVRAQTRPSPVRTAPSASRFRPA